MNWRVAFASQLMICAIGTAAVPAEEPPRERQSQPDAMTFQYDGETRSGWDSKDAASGVTIVTIPTPQAKLTRLAISIAEPVGERSLDDFRIIALNRNGISVSPNVVGATGAGLSHRVITFVCDFPIAQKDLKLISIETKAGDRSSNSGTVTGRVLNGNKPLVGVTVVMSPTDKSSPDRSGQEYVTTTDEAGAFVFSNVPPGEMYVYGLMRDLKSVGASPVRVCNAAGAGSVVRVGDLQIQQSFTISGRVVLSDDRPIPKGTRIAIARIATLPQLSPLDAQVVELASDGSFQVNGVPGGLVDVTTRVKGYRLANENPSLDRLNGFSINGIVRSNISSMHILLEPGKRIAVDPRTLEKDEARQFSREELEKKRRPLRGIIR